MARMTKRQIDVAIAGVEKETRLWDDDPRGLGLRIKPSGAATFFIQYRSPITFKKTRHSIDQYGRLTIHQARLNAKQLFELIAKGHDPAMEKRQGQYEAKGAVTVSEFCDDYLRDAEAGIVTYRGKAKKASTLAIDRGRIERHIKPTLGAKLVRDVTIRDVERAMHDIRLGKTAVNVKTGPRGRAIVTGGAGTASRSMGLLGSICSYAIKQGIRTDNPVSGVEVQPDGKRDRILSPNEYQRLGAALDAFEAKGANPVAIRAYRVLALTGCRRGEVFSLKRSEVDAHNRCFRFGDTKAGQQVRTIGWAALDLLTTLPGHVEVSGYCGFPGDGKRRFGSEPPKEHNRDGPGEYRRNYCVARMIDSQVDLGQDQRRHEPDCVTVGDVSPAAGRHQRVGHGGQRHTEPGDGKGRMRRAIPHADYRNEWPGSAHQLADEIYRKLDENDCQQYGEEVSPSAHYDQRDNRAEA